MSPDKTIRMANQIAAFFNAQGTSAEAASAVANHLKQFWDPRMRRKLIELVGDDGAADPAVVAAVRQLRDEEGSGGRVPS